MRKILSKTFFQRNTLAVARELLGKFLVRKIGKREIAGIITDVEAYDGLNDKASHASRGKTKRNEVMFRAGGVWYVYCVYGMYEMLNIVTREKGYPSAILIRGVLADDVLYKKTNGPGKLTKFFCIKRSLNENQAQKNSGLWIEDRGIKIKNFLRGKRIGIDYAGAWKHRLWRFYIMVEIAKI
ncbi:MAG: DNA-3-methyladenine glycosylase [Patescibacteria group bacterium]